MLVLVIFIAAKNLLIPKFFYMYIKNIEIKNDKG